MVERRGRKGGEIEGDRGRVRWGERDIDRMWVGGGGVDEDTGNSPFHSKAII